MNRYRIEYTMNDMPDGYIARSTKYARDEKEAMKYVGTKPDKAGSFRLKRGGIAKLKSITKLPND